MVTIRHCFIYPVHRPEDPFLGLKHLLSQQRLARHISSEVRLPTESYEIVRKVEYTSRRFFRFLHYTTVFRQLENSLREALDQCGRDNWCVIYLSDEGVWAEFLRAFRSRHPDLKLLSVNVQHGFAYPVPAKYKTLRRTVNWVLRKSWGYPAFGMGSLGGAGSRVFDIYLAYDKTTRDFISECTGDLVYVCPSAIKFGLFQRYREAKEPLTNVSCVDKQIMFALQPTAPRVLSSARIDGNLLGMFKELSSVARMLAEKHGKRIVFRPHPGMERHKVLEAFHRSGIDRYADIDELSELADSLARCSIVMSFYSTVLWEASILGLVPVSVQGAYHRGPLPFSHEILDVSANLEAHLEKVLSPETAEKYRREMVNENFDWEDIIMSCIGETSTVEIT